MSMEDYQCKQDVLLLNQNISIYIPVNVTSKWDYGTITEQKIQMLNSELYKHYSIW